MRVYMAIAARMYGPYIRAYIAITAPIYMWPLLPLHMAQSYIYMAVAARIHGHCYPYIYMAVTAPPIATPGYYTPASPEQLEAALLRYPRPLTGYGGVSI